MRKSPAFNKSLIDAFPEREAELRPLIDRATHLRRECGCEMGAAFLMVALIVAIGYVAIAPANGITALITQIVLALVFVFAASIAGKLLGIAIARVRLALLHRNLARRFAADGR